MAVGFQLPVVERKSLDPVVEKLCENEPVGNDPNEDVCDENAPNEDSPVEEAPNGGVGNVGVGSCKDDMVVMLPRRVSVLKIWLEDLHAQAPVHIHSTTSKLRH